MRPLSKPLVRESAFTIETGANILIDFTVPIKIIQSKNN